MKKIVLLIGSSILFLNCNGNKTMVEKKIGDYTLFGDGKNISIENSISATEMGTKYETLKPGDTLNVKFSSTIKDVCQNKGCWMKLPIGDQKETFVKFKDYGFFMPKDSKGDQVIVNGKAFVSMESVDDQRHYAKDGGMAQAEIDKIVTPKKTFSFLADGVLIKKID
jgi:Domain of unknown function (DUF4920)